MVVIELLGPYLEIFTMYVSVFMMQRYVLLEKGMEKNKQRLFYGVNFVITMLLTHIMPVVAQFYLLFMCGLNSCITRKAHKTRGFAMVIPIMGLVNGIVVPFINIPNAIFNLSQDARNLYTFSLHTIFAILVVLFYIKGKKWREQFAIEMKNRRLENWELWLLCVVGVLMIAYSNIYTQMFQYDVADDLDNAIISAFNAIIYEQNAWNQILMGVISFVLCVTVIVLVMQGNKRAYYYDQTLEMHQMEVEKQKAEAANEAKSSFLSTMSHEIRTPMNAIVGMTDILLREEHSKQTREYLNNIKNSGDALLTIINDILDFSKIESGKMDIIEDRYEPMSMFHDLSMIFFNRIGNKNVELLYDIDKDMPRKLYGDVQRIRQIIINLMNNAIKFTDSGFVKLTVETRAIDMENIELCFKIQDSGQGIKEEDIDKLFGSFQQVDQIRNHHKEGSGLGLAICKQLVELMHGTIGVESVYGEGSTFYFSIPQRIVDVRVAARLKTNEAKLSRVGIKIGNALVKNELVKLLNTYQIRYADLEYIFIKEIDFLIVDDIKNISDEEREELEKINITICVLHNPMKETLHLKNITVLTKPMYSLNICQLLNREEQSYHNVEVEEMNFTAPSANVLLVDDNEMNLKVAQGLLAPIKMQIDIAKNGKEAVDMVSLKQYHIVLMDHMMPVMDGVEATKEIRKLEGEYYQDLPIVALSANATSEAREMFLKQGMDDFVAKPIKIKDISKCILKWLPKDIVVVGETAKNETENIHNEDVSLPDIEGLDVKEGIKNCGSEELFYSLLGDFYKLIDAKSEKVEQCLADDKIREYTIEVHALKSMARMIGALQLSELFYEMEKLGNAQEREEIIKRTPEVLALYRSYKQLLADYVGKEEVEKTSVSTEKIKETLTRIHDAMDSFDLDEVDNAMKELETYEFSEVMQQMVEQLSIFVTDVAMEEVLNLTQEMCEKLDEDTVSEVVLDGDMGSDRKPKVMLIDDDTINTKAVKNMLQEQFHVIVAHSGKEAFALLKESKPDLILLDVYMPEMDGHEVICALKEDAEYVDIPVIFLTSDVEEHTEIQGFSEGAIDFLRKPFRKDVAIQRIRRILELSYLQKNLQLEVEKQTDVAEKRRESVERLSWQMVQALANTIDAKDSYTNGHSTRVAQYSVMLAEKMGYTGDKLEQLQYAAMLHDIGKIGVPKEIINKPAKLTDDEYAVIKTHPTIGASILKEITEIPDIAIGARWHHERYDGKGYPDGLSGEEIPELARIIGVADAYDAMTSKRSYRDVLPQEVVIGELEKGKDTQFDSKIAELMIQLIKEDTEYQMHE